MAAVSRIQATKQPPFPLKPVFEENTYPTKRLTHRIVLGADNRVDIRKLEVTFCPDPSDKERLVSVLDDFQEACEADALDYHDAQRHQKVVDVLGKDLRKVWKQTIGNVNAADQTNNNFVENVRVFLRTYLPRSSFQVQQEYMTRAVKPYHLDCYSVASRLRTINDLSVYLPGSGGMTLYPTATALKNAYYHLMLPKWQTTFDAAGHSTDDDYYTLDRMTAFMEQQRLLEDNGNGRRNGNNRLQQNNRFQPNARFRSNNRYQPYNNYRNNSNNQRYGNYNNRYSSSQRPGPGYVANNNNNNNTRDRGNQTAFGRGRNNQFRQNLNQGPRPFTRSQGQSRPPPRSNQNRETRGLYFHGDTSHDQSATISPHEDNFYQESPDGQPNDSFDNSDGFFGDQDNYDGEPNQSGAHQDSFFEQHLDFEQPPEDMWHVQDNYESYDSHDN